MSAAVAAAAPVAGAVLTIGPSMPVVASVPAALVMAGLLGLRLRRVPDRNLRFLVLAIWLRYALSAFHQVTFHSIVHGVTVNALGSLALFGSGMLLIRRDDLRIPQLLPLYAVVTTIIVSAVLNHRLFSAIDPVVKWGYLLVIIILTYRAVLTSGEIEVGKLLAWTFSFPVIFQIMSFVLRVAKAGESDGSVSWIGGYHHEAAFSIVIATALVATCLFKSFSKPIRLALIGYLLVALYLANYRTAILAVGPVLIVTLPLLALSLVQPRQRAFAAFVVGFVLLALIGVVGSASAARFADLGYILQHPGDLISRPDEISTLQRHILSGRLVIWSDYIYGYLGGGLKQRVIGFGPDAWVGIFPLYAHNTLVSSIYEFGLVGVICILALWATMLGLCFAAPRSDRLILMAAHISFIVLNMATMPYWLIEGDILYGLLCGYTLAKARGADVGLERTAARLVSVRRRAPALSGASL